MGVEVISGITHHGRTTLEVETAPPSMGVSFLAVGKLTVRCDVAAVTEYKPAGPSNVWSFGDKPESHTWTR